MCISVNITVWLVAGSACKQQAGSACFSSFIGFCKTAVLESRSSQNANPEPLAHVTFWKQLFAFEIIQIAIAID